MSHRLKEVLILYVLIKLTGPVSYLRPLRSITIVVNGKQMIHRHLTLGLLAFWDFFFFLQDIT